MDGLTRQWWRLGGACGFIFIVLFIIGGFMQGEPPDYDAPVAEIRTFWEEDGDTYLIGDYIIGIAVTVFFLPFLVAFRTLLGRAEGGIQIWSRVGFYGGLLMIAFSAAAAGVWTALGFAAENLSDDALVTLMYLDIGAWNAFPFAVGILLLFSSLSIAQTGVIWRWLGWVGIIVGILAFITPLGILDDDPEDAFDTLGFIPFIGLALWLLLISIAMFIRKEEPAQAA